jgi:Asp-tRNA(Asn)/Glu-tRNA(Gln) amidotransferase C subunit
VVGHDAVMAAVRLARLDLASDELERIVAQVANILDHIEELSAVAVGDAPAVGGITEADAPLRQDVDGPDPLMHPPSALASGWVDGFFTLPRLAAMEATGEAEP